MNCDEVMSLMADRLNGRLADDDEHKLDEHLRDCFACRDEAAAISSLWAEMGEADDHVPHERMRVRFHAAVAAYEQRARSRGLIWVADVIGLTRPALQAGIAAALIVFGVVIGRGWSATGEEIETLRRDVRAMSVALLNHQSASERLLGVSQSMRNASYSPASSALLDVVRYDGNLNVRLAAVEALAGWLDQPEVGSGLLQALEGEKAPLMQVTLVDLLLDHNVGGAVIAVQRLLDEEDLDPIVRDFARTALSEVGKEQGGNVI